MSSDIRIKICGLTEPVGLDAAIKAGASYIGFVHFARSPRHVEAVRARQLALQVPEGVAKVALMVNPEDDTLDAFLEHVPIDLLQLHGQESTERVAAIRARCGLPVMKAIGVSDHKDLEQINRYTGVADQILIDAKPPKGSDRPGGNAVSFDWNLIAGRRWYVPWMLAGGLTAQNVAEAIRTTGARQLDLSSAVESAPGIKDPAKIADFFAAVADIGPSNTL